MLVVAATSYGSYRFGLEDGVRAAPEVVQAMKERDKLNAANEAAFMAVLDQVPDGQGAVCEQIFDLVAEQLADDQYLLADDMDQHSPDRN